MRSPGKLLPASAGVGTVDANSSVGALDLGGASTQIAFFVPNQDILANMFKLQLGGQKHWNVYVHSFLYYGINSSKGRQRQAYLEARLLVFDVLLADVVQVLAGQIVLVALRQHHLAQPGATWQHTRSLTIDATKQGKDVIPSLTDGRPRL